MDTKKKLLSFLSPQLVEAALEKCSVAEFAKGTQILRDEQYIKVLPIVINGLVKVFSRFDDKELLLYYIGPEQSCVMTFAAALKNTPSKVYAITEEDSSILLIPVEFLPKWLREFSDLRELFYGQYDLRYSELLDTIRHLLVDKMDKRLYDYIKQKLELTNHSPVRLSHVQIANELGTAREVVTRILKKLETDGKISQNKDGIIIIDRW